jgi:hypothetical protein
MQLWVELQEPCREPRQQSIHVEIASKQHQITRRRALKGSVEELAKTFHLVYASQNRGSLGLKGIRYHILLPTNIRGLEVCVEEMQYLAIDIYLGVKDSLVS